MTNESPSGLFEALNADPLSEPTRKTRKGLLGVGAAGMVVGLAGVVPTKIEGLGIELAAGEQSWVRILLALVIGYYLLTFCVYAARDYLYRRVAYERAEVKLASQGKRPGFYSGLASKLAKLRSLTDFYLPFGVGCVGLACVLRAMTR